MSRVGALRYRVKGTSEEPQPLADGTTGGPDDAYVALPAHSALGKMVRVFRHVKTGGPPKTVRHVFKVRDVGPWNGRNIDRSQDDEYWLKDGVPQAESGTDLSGRKTNGAGIDLSWAAWVCLGVPAPKVKTHSESVDWEFV
jgi:hypothetical protein